MKACLPFLRAAATAMIALHIGGCAQPIMTRVSGVGSGVMPSARLSFLVPEPDSPVMDPTVRKALTDRLTTRGYAVVEGGDHMLDVSLSDRAATMGVRGEAAGSWMSGSKAKRPLQSCANRVHRLTLAVVKQATGVVVYRGQAEEHHCKGTLQESMLALVDAVVADMTKPAGTAVLTRTGRN
jgi:hypothetical protein